MLNHLLRIQHLQAADIIHLLDRSEVLLNNIVKPRKLLSTLTGRIITNFFFEPSTRTRQSFTIAANRLGAIVLNPAMEQSATVKGESLQDTLQTYIAMGCQFFIVRHPQNYFAEEVAALIEGYPAAVINGGDGNHQHPTQTLLDLLTIRQRKLSFIGLKVAIVGDIAHSRVAGSLIPGLKLMGVDDIRLVSPIMLLPPNAQNLGVELTSDISSGIRDADVIVTLRIQRERMLDDEIPDSACFHQGYGITQKILHVAKPDVIVMHPGPVNRDVEISSDVVDGANSVILSQVENGIAVRMAVLEWLSQKLPNL